MATMVRIRSGRPAQAALLRGVDQMAGLLRPTLGPLPRTVAIGRLTSLSLGPEILDSGAVIARRTLQLADPFEDMGGMLIRHLVWQVHERAGDGTVTAAVLAQSMLRASARLLAAGYNPIAIRRGMQHGLDLALKALLGQARAVDSPDDILRVIRTSLADRSDIAEMLAEVLDSVGPDGAILIENAHGTATKHEYLDGIRWNEGFLSSFLLTATDAGSARLMNPRVFTTDYSLERVDQMLPVLEACVQAGERSLLGVAPEMSDGVIGLLVANRERGVLEAVMAVKAPSFGVQRTQILEDIAAVTGGRCVCLERQDRLADVTANDLGRARQAWAARSAFGILGGRGDKAVIRQRIARVKAELVQVPTDDVYTTALLRERIGKLAGTAAIVRVGAAGQAEQEEVKTRIEAAVSAGRSALTEGVVPGGGAALIACATVLHSSDMCRSSEEAAGVRVLEQALAEPMRVILKNAGLEPEVIVNTARQNGMTYDVLRREFVDPWRAGFADPLSVTQAALESSVSAVATALTSEVLIHRKDAPTAVRP